MRRKSDFFKFRIWERLPLLKLVWSILTKGNLGYVKTLPFFLNLIFPYFFCFLLPRLSSSNRSLVSTLVNFSTYFLVLRENKNKYVGDMTNIDEEIRVSPLRHPRLSALILFCSSLSVERVIYWSCLDVIFPSDFGA